MPSQQNPVQTIHCSSFDFSRNIYQGVKTITFLILLFFCSVLFFPSFLPSFLHSFLLRPNNFFYIFSSKLLYPSLIVTTKCPYRYKAKCKIIVFSITFTIQAAEGIENILNQMEVNDKGKCKLRLFSILLCMLHY